MISTFITLKDFALITLSFLFVYLITKFVLIPWRTINSYKKEGVSTFFFPIIGIFRMFTQALKLEGDYMATSKASSKLSPNQKCLVTNITNNPLFCLRDPQYLREFLQNKPYMKKLSSSSSSKP